MLPHQAWKNLMVEKLAQKQWSKYAYAPFNEFNKAKVLNKLSPPWDLAERAFTTGLLDIVPVAGMHSNPASNPDVPKNSVENRLLGFIRRSAIYFEDESGIRSDFHAGTTWALKGETPVIKVTGARFSTNMIAAIGTRGHLKFMVHKGGVNADVICDFF